MHVKSENPLVAQCKFGAVANSELLSHTQRCAHPFFKNRYVRMCLTEWLSACRCKSSDF